LIIFVDMLPKNIPHSIGCPFCQGIADLEWQKNSTSMSMSFFYDHLSYYCKTCKNAFTTTDSDTISLKRYQVKKRSVYRKNKIKKII